LLSHDQQLSDLLLDLLELGLSHYPDLLTRNFPAVPHLQDGREFGQRKARAQSPPNQAHPFYSLRRVSSIASESAWRLRQKTQTLIVSEGVCTYAGKTSQFSRLHSIPLQNRGYTLEPVPGSSEMFPEYERGQTTKDTKDHKERHLTSLVILRVLWV
jgi:hypothetical protein